MADALGDSTIAGTSLTQALVKLTKPSQAGEKIMKKYKITVKKFADGQLDLAGIFEQIGQAADSIEEPMRRARMITELFGIRGQKAAQAFLVGLDHDAVEQKTRSCGELTHLTSSSSSPVSSSLLESHRGFSVDAYW